MRLSFEELEKRGYVIVDSNYADSEYDFTVYKNRYILKYGKKTKVYRIKTDTKGLISYVVYAKK